MKEKVYEDSFSKERRETIAFVLKNLRERKGMTQREVAHVLHIADSTISHYEKGISVPSTEMRIRLADFYNVTTDYLLGNCSSRINYSKQIDFKLTKEMTVGKAVEIMTKSTDSEKQTIANILHYIDNQKNEK